MMRRVLVAGALLAVTSVAGSASAQLSIGINIRLAPPPLPVYVQPALPGPDYLWTPGYWAWDAYGQEYFWVPGTWVRAPRPGLLWTPPWWGWSNGFYAFHSGYWGPHIGFYGGVPYGFGYTGFGYQGGYWNGGHVFYNRTVNNVTNVNVTNVYQRNVTVNQVTRVSYNGGPGGVQATPRPEERQAAAEQHVAPTGGQQAHVAAAHADPRAFASANGGRPPMAATPRPLTASRPNGQTPDHQRPAAQLGPQGRPAAADRQPLAGDRQPADRLQVPRNGPAAADRESEPHDSAMTAPPQDRERGDDPRRDDVRRPGGPGGAAPRPREQPRPQGGAPHPHPASRPAPHPHPQPRPKPNHPHPPANHHDDHH